MTDFDYTTIIESLIVNGRGYQAITDLSKLLEKISVNKDAVLSEYKWERRTIIKFCDNPNTTNKTKINDIRSMLISETEIKDNERK